MSMFQTLIDRELGIHRSFSYDSVLSRLVVDYSYASLLPNVERLDYNPIPPIFACKFAEVKSYRHILALANEDGRIGLYDARKHYPSPIFGEHDCHLNAIFDIAWSSRDMRLITASGDHTVKFWNIGNERLSLINSFHGHSRSVRVCVFKPEDSFIFATGGRDGQIFIWDSRVNINRSVLTIHKSENCISNAHPIIMPRTPGSSSKKYNRMTERINSVTGLVFQDKDTLISCGSGDGSIRVWDLRRTYSSCKRDPIPKHSIPFGKNGYSNIILDNSTSRLYANCMDHTIYCYDMGTYNSIPIRKYSGYTASFYIKSSLSPDGKYLISGSNDENAYIWNVKYPEPILKLSGHTAEVTCAVWSKLETTLIATCSDDNIHKIWKIGKELYNHIEAMSLLGKAHEILPKEKFQTYWNMLERTPRSSKRKLASDSSTEKSLKKNDNDSSTDISSQYKRKPKRSLFEMQNKSLFSIVEEDNSPKRLKSDCDPGPSTSSAYWDPHSEPDSELKTPTKFSNKSPGSPQMFSSPTMNLPNFVSDGRAPHLRHFTPQKRKEVDWLTKLVREKINNKVSKGESIDDSTKKAEETKSDKTILSFFRVIPSPLTTPLSDKTNEPNLGCKRKASECHDSVPAKRFNLETESNRSPTNKKVQKNSKSHKSLRAYFKSRTDHENQI